MNWQNQLQNLDYPIPLSPKNLRILNNNKNSINQLYNDFKNYVLNNNILSIVQDNQDEFEHSLNKSQSFNTIMNQLKVY